MKLSDVCGGFSLPEGPAFDRDGVLHIVEIRGGRVQRIDTESGSSRVLAEPGGGPNGSAFGPDGGLYVCNNGGMRWGRGAREETFDNGRIERVLADGTVEVVLDSHRGQALSGPNDIAFDADGGFYFTDPGHVGPGRVWPPGHVYWGTPDGAEIRRVASGLQLPNGLGLCDEGRALIVAESETRALWEFPVAAAGELGPGRDLARLPDGFVPDGICFDEEQNIICAGIEGGALVVFDRSGEQVEHLDMNDSYPTNVAFGGPRGSTLFVTLAESGRVGSLEWPRPGLPLFGLAAATPKTTTPGDTQ